MYMMAKHLHLTAVVLSILLFIIRFVLFQMKSGAANHKALRILPHIAYTALVLSAAWLCVILQSYPFVVSWITFKLFGLIAFVLTAIWATTWAKKKPIQWFAFFLALICLSATAHVAFSKQPLFF